MGSEMCIRDRPWRVVYFVVSYLLICFGIALSNFVAQCYGAGLYGRIREGVRASLIQTEAANLFMCVLLLACRNAVTPFFIDNPTAETIQYANGYLLAVAPFYVILGLLLVFRTAVQSMGNSRAPFAACLVELVMRIGGTFGLSRVLGYTGICLSSPLAWACLLYTSDAADD